MPVTAKLSRRFYEALGDDVANELVDWFNAVDLTYRAQLKELNDANWERFKAVAASKADLGRFATKADLDRFATKADLDRFAAKADQQFAAKADLAEMKAELMRWMFVFWTATITPLGALIVAMHTVFAR